MEACSCYKLNVSWSLPLRMGLNPQIISQCVLVNHWPRGVQTAASQCFSLPMEDAGDTSPRHPGTNMRFHRISQGPRGFGQWVDLSLLHSLASGKQMETRFFTWRYGGLGKEEGYSQPGRSERPTSLQTLVSELTGGSKKIFVP